MKAHDVYRMMLFLLQIRYKLRRHRFKILGLYELGKDFLHFKVQITSLN